MFKRCSVRALLAAVAATALVLVAAIPASAAASRYVVVFKQGQTQAGVRAVKAAGGRVAQVNRKVGVASVRSRRGSFLRALRRATAVKSAGREGAFKQPPLAATSADPPPPPPSTPGQAATGCGQQYFPQTGGQGVGPDPLSVCQWDMRVSNASPTGSYAVNQGEGTTVGIIDTGLDLVHPDIAPNLDLEDSCSFIRADTPTADPRDVAVNCTQKDKVQDYGGHGTHVGGTVGAPINGVGVAGVAPATKLAGLKAGTAEGYFFVQPTVDALVWAGDRGIDVVNMSFFVDPYLYNCKNEEDQKAIVDAVSRASAYAARRGVVQIAAAGNEASDLDHPTTDEISPDYPPGEEVVRTVHNNCVVVPTELPNVSAVSTIGPQKRLSFYSSYSHSKVDFTAGGGDSRQAPNPYGRVLNAWSGTAPLADDDPIVKFGRQVEDCNGPTGSPPCFLYVWIQGTSMASPHAAGVAALIRSAHPDMPPKAVIARERNTAMPLACPADPRCVGGPKSTNFYGSGIVDALAAGTR